MGDQPSPDTQTVMRDEVLPILWDAARRLDICYRADNPDHAFTTPVTPTWDDLTEDARHFFLVGVTAVQAVPYRLDLSRAAAVHVHDLGTCGPSDAGEV